MEFPIFKTRIEGAKRRFNLTDPQEQKDYFYFKAGGEIEKLREYLKENTFIAYFLGKKNAGKGTYSKMFTEIVNRDAIDHLSVGDMVRSLDTILQDPEKKKALVAFLEKNYRGWVPLKDILSSLEKRDTKTLLPNELILAFVKGEIMKRKKKAIFIDGFPRNLDQISYSLFFRDLVGYRDDPDFFILIDVPTSVIDERIKWRRVCPSCQTSRNLKLLTTSKIGYREETKEFYLMCDNPDCAKQNIAMVVKEGDELGTAPIKERLETDAKLIEQAFSLHGIPKILLRNTVPAEKAKEYIDDYEITPEYVFEWDEKTQKVDVKEKPWVVLDDQGVPSYSLLPQAVVVSLIKQMVQVLGL
ncbi:MAG: Uncharacterized protein Greene071421_230 [Parcubacteria group bacterium Greene0714_21]|nr:MAG: Uncharacterized protein Greene041639_304 [Parcubacteria group bacterium Greene0416_39]TSC97249.1 MAG: Uncharacterized protein Greene101447_571 [Parcubacteria group bacterium Greene1014_47]TSD04394.1 MAG: Uncharacterized protein Greene071421_230 [Parcubacteria group bacterium Greene0714_21]